MSFRDKLKSGKPLLTMDVIPPKGTDVSGILDRIRPLKGRVDAVNVTDMPSAAMRMSALPLSHLLKEHGFEPILQMTCRDRNRLSLQADLLGAAALGIENLLILHGDPIELSDDPNAKGVFDLDSVGFLQAARTLQTGHDLTGKKLNGSPVFCLGAVCDPASEEMETEIQKMQDKLAAGAEFFQTQPVYDVNAFADFLKMAPHLKTPLLAGIFLLKSAKMGRFINQNVPGINIPENILDEMDNSPDPQATSIEIATRTIKALENLCQGVHIMSIGWEDKVPQIIDALGL